jgi:hypothetical protein
MMAKDVTSGADRLFARLDIAESDFFPDITVQQAASMKRKYYQVQVPMHQFLQSVRTVLDGQGLSLALVGAYYAVANKMRRTVEAAGYGDTGKNEIAALIALYVARGLTLSVLESIRNDCIGIAAPAGP